MKSEFVRYRMAKFRTLVGSAQILCAIALVLNTVDPIFGIIGSGGLCIIMTGALGVRVRIRDRLKVTLPAVIYFMLSSISLFFNLTEF